MTLTQNATGYEDGLAPISADDKWFDAMPTYAKGIHPPCVNDETSSLEGQHNGLKTKGGPFHIRQQVPATGLKISRFLSDNNPPPYESSTRVTSQDMVMAAAMGQSELYPKLVKQHIKMRVYAGGWRFVNKQFHPSEAEWERLQKIGGADAEASFSCARRRTTSISWLQLNTWMSKKAPG